MVRVIAKDGTVLQPTNRHGKVRRLLDNNKAEVVCKKPFTIRLLYEVESKETQKAHVYFDTGGKYQGFAIIANGKVIYKGTIELRDGIPKLLKQRSQYRRGRRHRKTRYRQPRFDNRKRKEGWLPPSVQSKYNHIIRWLDKLISYLPDYELTVEIANFDIQKLKDNDIKKEGYQQGELCGYENAKQFLIFRENNKCQLCDKEKGTDTWNVHHLIPSKEIGTDSPDNLTLLHSECHEKLHNNELESELNKKVEKLEEQQSEVEQFKYTTFMNIIKNRFCSTLKSKYEDKVNFTYGYITNVNRRKMELEKKHYNDAIAMHGKPIEDKIKPIYIKQARKKKRSLHEAVPRAGRSNRINRSQTRNKKNTKEVIKNGKKWALWDKVYIPDLQTSGFVSGFTGKWIYVQDIDGQYLKLPNRSYKQMNPDSVSLICRNNNWIRKQIA